MTSTSTNFGKGVSPLREQSLNLTPASMCASLTRALRSLRLSVRPIGERAERITHSQSVNGLVSLFRPLLLRDAHSLDT